MKSSPFDNRSLAGHAQCVCHICTPQVQNARPWLVVRCHDGTRMGVVDVGMLDVAQADRVRLPHGDPLAWGTGC